MPHAYYARLVSTVYKAGKQYIQGWYEVVYKAGKQLIQGWYAVVYKAGM